MIRMSIGIAVLTLACAGCSKPPEPQAPAPVAAASVPRVATPWDALEADKKRAQDVQKTVDEQAKRQRDAVEQQTQ
ncbi:hypothetical protein FHW69_000850 [Luteibacter sp. Sphag1AF]|uniref:hypothetical protein n=1 Tax=Luteibacter sp. Sphag1AF TaxID=2587031 RepID=UPI001621A95F|nr:hypothetical protein [Luteibacter sp. Sphag1AF]MBB3226260.1 hypothetical protein [Luteibacter sp. Sphag1AF]